VDNASARARAATLRYRRAATQVRIMKIVELIVPMTATAIATSSATATAGPITVAMSMREAELEFRRKAIKKNVRVTAAGL
ncbi:MAG TPA: hypothetical protein VLL05_04020, partial [Terriglobales bacterium]|nr:hypothetical protein [Terriglobales bacterium]